MKFRCRLKFIAVKKIFTIILPFLILLSFKASSLPLLSSLPPAKATIFLDFDGHYVDASSWSGGVPFYCEPSGLSDAQIIQVFNRVSEDYRPFNINITTDSIVFLAAPLNQRIRIIITLTSGWYAGVGGVSFTGSFTWGDDTPGFVFPDRLAYSAKNIAECCSHESGHTLGLSHQAKYNGSCALLTVYNDGIGNGETGWAPVMGNSYGRNLSGWNNGPTPSGCTSDQDNLSIITSKNGFTYRQDDHTDDPDENPTAVETGDSQILANGIISTNSDKDVFKFNIRKDGILHLEARPFSVGNNNDGANLDIKITLLNSAAGIIKIYDPASILNVVIDTALHQGTYYIIVQGTGNLNASNYGSLGSYDIEGRYTPLYVEPAAQVLLSGKTENKKHDLSWDIISDAPLKNIFLETSADSAIFSTLTAFTPGIKDFSYAPVIKEKLYYRLAATSEKGQLVYSNVISLKGAESKIELFTVATLVNTDIKVNAPENFKYQVVDISGRVIKSGGDNAGIKNININHCPDGIYFLQIISNSQRTTQRIVKL